MCHACIVESVKSNMLSRRSLFSGATAGAAALAMGAAAARPALAQSSGKVVDLTHPWDGDFPTFDGKPGILYEPGKILDRDGYQLWKLTIFEHSGTHVDAPLHFSADGASVDQLPAAGLVCPLCVLDLRAKASEDANAMVQPEDIEAWISANGEIPAGAVVAMHSGWAAKLAEVGRTTLYRWMENDEFRRELVRLRSEALDLAHVELKGLMLKATQVLGDTMDDTNPFVRLRAAQIALSIGLKAIEVKEIQRRVELLDDALPLWATRHAKW